MYYSFSDPTVTLAESGSSFMFLLIVDDEEYKISYIMSRVWTEWEDNEVLMPASVAVRYLPGAIIVRLDPDVLTSRGYIIFSGSPHPQTKKVPIASRSLAVG